MPLQSQNRWAFPGFPWSPTWQDLKSSLCLLSGCSAQLYFRLLDSQPFPGQVRQGFQGRSWADFGVSPPLGPSSPGFSPQFPVALAALNSVHWLLRAVRQQLCVWCLSPMQCGVQGKLYNAERAHVHTCTLGQARLQFSPVFGQSPLPSNICSFCPCL